MKYLLSVPVLFLATMAIAQQGQPPPTSPPYATPPTFPREPRVSPPGEQVPPQEGLSASQIQQQIQQNLKSEPALSNTDVNVHADRDSVILTGTVNSEQQHGLALRIAESYAGDRKIVDKIKVREQT